MHSFSTLFGGVFTMTINYDEKGKIFTDIVPKEVVEARIQTTSHFIEGQIHVRPGSRLKDELDLEEPFLAVTNVRVFSSSQEVLFRAKFVAIRRDQIIWVTTAKDIDAEAGS
jgi:hypothetical protein